MKTKNMKNIDLAGYIPDPQKFLRFVRHVLMTPRKRFRLKKWATTVRKNLSTI